MPRNDPSDEQIYQANVVAAWALAIADRVNERTAEVVAHGPSAPAVLTTLRFTPGLSMERLAATVGLTSPGAVQLCNRLEAAGLVERSAGGDRRRRHPQLTPAGRRMAERLLSARRGVVEAAMSGMPAADREEAGRLAEAMLLQLSGTRELANRICRLCDERACPDDRCPSELALPPEQRMKTACP